MPIKVAINLTIRNSQPSSPPIVPGSSVAIRLFQVPSTKPNGSASASVEPVIPKARMIVPRKTTDTIDTIASH